MRLVFRQPLSSRRTLISSSLLLPLSRRSPKMSPCEAVVYTPGANAITLESFKGDGDVDLDGLIVLDCTHPSALTLSHHKAQRRFLGSSSDSQDDSSTGICLSALKQQRARVEAEIKRVSTNHFDVDSFCSVFSLLFPDASLAHEARLRHCARIGDFRDIEPPGPGGEFTVTRCPPGAEGRAPHEWVGPELGGGVAGHVQELRLGLALCCWLNTVEAREFSRPYEEDDAEDKFKYFLPRFAAVLADPWAHVGDWREEYDRVVGELIVLQEPGRIEHLPSSSLAIVRAPSTLHYYSLFSAAGPMDYVLAVYDGGRYELEARYTQFVEIWSRPVAPRVDFTRLSQALNALEARKGEFEWTTPRLVDTGPLLRLDSLGRKLSKMERYGHPFMRPVHPSKIEEDVFVSLVKAYLAAGAAHGPAFRPGGFSWEELQGFNKTFAAVRWTEGLPAPVASVVDSTAKKAAALAAAVAAAERAMTNPNNCHKARD